MPVTESSAGRMTVGRRFGSAGSGRVRLSVSVIARKSSGSSATTFVKVSNSHRGGSEGSVGSAR